MIFKQIVEDTFKEVEIEVEDELYEVARKLQKSSGNDMPILAAADGKELRICVSGGIREPGERDTHKYLIKIEKIPYD